MSVVIVRSFSAGTAASALVMGSLLGTLPIGRARGSGSRDRPIHAPSARATV